MHGLGWVVNPRTHPGFAGKLRPYKTEDSGRPVGLSAQIPSRPFPYYTDAITELAFIMPTLRPSAGDSAASLRSVESSDSSQDVSTGGMQLLTPAAVGPGLLQTQVSQPVPLHHHHHHHQPGPTELLSATTKHESTTYMNIEAFPAKDSVGSGVSESSVIAEGFATYPGLSRAKKTSRAEAPAGSDTPRRRWAVPPQDCAAMVVWLEKLDDCCGFPTEVLSKMLHATSFSGFGGSHKVTHHAKKCLPVIFIHRMSSGLYQISTNNSGGRCVCVG